MTLPRALIVGPPTLNRNSLSREFCRGFGWFKPDSGLKDTMAQVPMLTDRPATATEQTGASLSAASRMMMARGERSRCTATA